MVKTVKIYDMGKTRPAEEIFAEIEADIRELRERYMKDCSDEVLSCRAAASYIGRSPVTISRWLSMGKLTKVTSGGRTGIRKSELRRVLRARE